MNLLEISLGMGVVIGLLILLQRILYPPPPPDEEANHFEDVEKFNREQRRLNANDNDSADE